MSPDNVAARSTTAVAWAIFGAAGKIAGQLIVQITLVRLLGPEAFGQFAAVTAVMSLVALLTECGLGSALIQKKYICSEDIGLALGRSLAVGIASGAIVFFAAPILAKYFGDASLESMFKFCAVLGVIYGPMNISLSLLQRELNIKRIQIMHLISYTLVYGGIAITLALMGWGGWSLIVGYFAQSAFALMATCSVIGAVRPSLHGDNATVSFGLRSLVTGFSNWSMETFDQLLVGKFWGVHALGLYTVTINLCRAPTGLLIYLLQNIAFSSAARLQDNPAMLRKGYLIALAAIALATLPLFLLVSFEASTVLELVYGPKWSKAAPIMTAVALAMPLVAISSVTAAILRGTGAVGIELRTQLVAAIILLGGFFSLGNMPLATVAWTVPVAYCVRLVALLWEISRRLELSAGDLFLSLRGAALLAIFGICAAAGTASIIPGTTTLMGGLLPLAAGSSAVLLPCLYRFSWFAGVLLTSALRTGFYGGSFYPIVSWLVREPR